MENELNIRPQTFRKDLDIYMGKLVDCHSEMSHVTIYYEFNPARGVEQICTFCSAKSPKLLKYEKDHMGQVFWDALCGECSPKSLLDNLSAG
ncbi:MAG TPA: hypothetical protein VFI61_00825 [Patescibacteria group bacterium]|nr:hypothetical protein [Patescibacteria group bacterium]